MIRGGEKVIDEFRLGLIEVVMDGVVGACMGFGEFVEVESARVFGTHIRWDFDIMII